MFKLINRYRNVIRIVKTDKERDRLIARGYALCFEKAKSSKNNTSNKRGTHNVKK